MKNKPGEYQREESSRQPPDGTYTMRRYSEPDPEATQFTYGRPSLPSWIAAVAVAFAFFLLGGFIKTYQQLQSLREESRREIAELRDTMRRLQVQNQPAPRQSSPRLTPLPPAERRSAAGYYDYTRQTFQAPVAVRPPPVSTYPVTPEPGQALSGQTVRPREPISAGFPLLPLEEAESSRPRYQIGRRSPDDSGGVLSTRSGGACQVVSVSTTQNRIMVEGGRDAGLTEGARLELVRNGRWIADLRTVDVFDNQTACEVLHATVQPQPGDVVRRPPQ